MYNTLKKKTTLKQIFQLSKNVNLDFIESSSVFCNSTVILREYVISFTLLYLKGT